MKWFKFSISLFITLALVILLDHKWGNTIPAAFGKLLSPREGFWQNAEPVDKNFSGTMHLPGLTDKVDLWLDDRLVPHIFANNEHDLYYVQGYITAKFRLWQMEIQTMAAAGRVSEILGPASVQYDRTQRRKGMVTAAESSLKKMESDPVTKAELDAYRDGVNAWIASLDERTLPLEYKLLDYKPEKWTNLQSALLLIYMSDVLTGNVNDLENTNARKVFSKADFDQMFPDFPDSLDPIIPIGTKFGKPTSVPQPPAGDSLLASGMPSIPFSTDKPDPDNGSNNWAVSGKKTRSGAPILCNDPHLGLHLPSLWYEVQLHAPSLNVYGASLPGMPGVVIGFNDSLAWGVTNAQRDVKDFYAIRFRDSSKKEYWFDKEWRKTDLHIEEIRVRGHRPVYDTVAYTVFGPVMFDGSYPDTLTGHPALAVHWQAAEGSNELMTFNLLNHAKNYADYLAALRYFECPGQNFAYADKRGNIAIWQQGKFPLKWKDQGKYILPGADSSYAWQGFIPYADNPHILNPERGFVSSANQNPTDNSYPYYYNGDFIAYRGHRINDRLRAMNDITIDDMEGLQTDVYSLFAATALPLMRRFLHAGRLTEEQQKYLDLVDHWDRYNTPESKAATVFRIWWDSLYADIWTDEFSRSRLPLPWPGDRTTIEWLLRDSAMHFIDNINTPQKETLTGLDRDAFFKAVKIASAMDHGDSLKWGDYKSTNIMHLAGIPAFSRMDLKTGGGKYEVNAIKKDHGPSWRMIVQLSNPTEAYGIYPGGQSGNPGSPYYDNSIYDWVAGRYYRLHMMEEKDSAAEYVKYHLRFSN